MGAEGTTATRGSTACTECEGHAPDVLQTMKDNLERLRRHGVEAIDD